MDLQNFWQFGAQDVLNTLQTTNNGLSKSEATKRLAAIGTKKKQRPQILKDSILFFSQFKSPLTLLLVAAVILSFFLGEKTHDAR